MKKLLLILLISSVAFSQNVAKKETINKFLLKTWTADYAMMNGQKIEKMGQMKKMEYVFKADNTYTLNKDKSGQWKYDEKKKCIELFQDGKLRSTITSLKEKSFVMTLNPDKAAPKGVKDFQIFFKPKA
ncbi:MAG: hypothetical protein QM710_00665 [Flavobacterium sp.]